MKLALKFNLIYLVSTLFLFTVFSVFFYTVISSILNTQLNSDLQFQKNLIIAYLRNNDSIPDKFPEVEDYVRIENHPLVIRSMFVDTLVKFKNDPMYTSCRQLIFTYKKKDQRYKITISKSTSDIHELKTKIIQFELLALLILLVSLTIMNNLMSKYLLKPLTYLSQRFSVFDIKNQTHFDVLDSSTTEFKLLQDTFKSMLVQIKADFENMRLFTENASHEMQTPLTIIKNSIELLIQKSGYSESQIKLIQNISNHANKLKKIHNDLLMLSKLEGNYFENNSELDYKTILQEVLLNYAPIQHDKMLNVTFVELNSSLHISNKEVACSMFNNLISNAMKHSVERSEIQITLNQQVFVISNQGLSSGMRDSSKLFERFYKENKHSESTGLGLSIVKQICINMHYNVEYKQESDRHVFFIEFEGAQHEKQKLHLN